MQRIDIECHGARLGVVVDDAAMLPEVERRLPPDSRVLSSGGSTTVYRVRATATGYAVCRGDDCLAQTTERTAALEALQSALHFGVALEATRVFVHAGVVGWRDRAIVIPGLSMSGKTSLVAALVRAGAIYYSDEYAAIDDGGRVHPYAKPLSIRGHDGAPARLRTASEIGGRSGRDPLPVGLVVAARYRKGACGRARWISPGRGVLELLSHTVVAQFRPEECLRTLGRAVADARCVRVTRGEADAMAARVLSWADGLFSTDIRRMRAAAAH